MDVGSSSTTHAKVKQELPDFSLLLKREETQDEKELLTSAEDTTLSSSAPSLLHVDKRDELPEPAPAGQPLTMKNSDSDPSEDQPSNHPKETTRLIFDCVLVWRRADLQRHRKKETEKDLQMMKAIKNPKIKQGVKNMGLKPSTIRSRLQAVGLELFDIQLDKMMIDTLVPRIFLSNTFGGSPQEVHPRIAEKFLNVHGHNDWMYLVTDYHPDAPQVPGAPGIYLEFYEDGEWQRGRMRVFTRVQTSPNLWQYMGMYEVKLGTSLTKEEWAEQTSLVRMTWASRIANSDWANFVSARIRARRDLGREPSQGEIENIRDSFKVGEMVTAQQVEAAYLAGEEIMGVYTMKCIGYDYDFQRGLCEKFRNWAPPPARPRTKKPIKIKRE